MRKKMGQCFAKGGATDAHVKSELKFMKDKGAPSSMVAAEKKEHGMPAFAGGGSSGGGSAGTAGKSRFVGHGAFNFGKQKAQRFDGGGSTFADDVAQRKAAETPDWLPPPPSADSTGPNKNIDDATRERAMAAVGGSAASQPAEPAAFKDAFKAARSGGAKTFDWHGKKYTTELASGGGGRSSTQGPSHAPGPMPSARPGADYSNEGRGAPAPAAAPAPAPAPAAVAPVRGSPSPKARDTTGFAETAYNKVRSAFDERPTKPGTRQTGMGPMPALAKGGSVGFAKGGSIDGCASRGKTRGRVV